MVHDLYQEIILDHSKRPRNCHPMDDANRKAEGYNPLCGDKLKLYLKMENDVVKDVSFVGSGCAISTASASLMTESMKGKTREEALKAMEKFHDLLTTDSPVTTSFVCSVVTWKYEVVLPYTSVPIERSDGVGSIWISWESRRCPGNSRGVR